MPPYDHKEVFVRRVSLAATLVLALCALAPAPASAADDPVTRKKVQSYLDLAADLFKSSDYEGALGELRRAEALSDLAVVRFNIARCLEELHKPADAVAAYKKYLSLNDATDGAPERTKRANDAIAKLTANPGGLEVPCPKGATVVVVGLTDFASTCPYRAEHVTPGIYEVQVSAKGKATVVAKVEVESGKTAVANLAAAVGVAAPPPGLVPVPAPAPGAGAGMTVSVRFVAGSDGDRLTVSAEGATCDAPCELALAPGRHNVNITGDATFNERIDVPGAPSLAKIEKRKGGFRAMGVIGLSVGLPAFGIGLICTLLDVAVNEGLKSNVGYAGVGLMSIGLVLAVVGPSVGFPLAGKNKVEIGPAGGSARDDRGSKLQLVSWGVAPTPHGGLMGGVTLSF
jgi:hypothetical protein